MADVTNLSDAIEKQLPPELVEFMEKAGLVAAGRGESLYLVGGVVRDLLLGRPTLDLDLVVEGDAIDLARQLAGLADARITTHPRFRTATLKWDKWSVDLATARSESYSRPGALPTVKPGSISLDLARRDFTINTLAIELIPGRWGSVIDLYGGRKDLNRGLVRVLHEGSFIDDATRIWRALRYEQRLGFRLEPGTLRLLKRDIPLLETISPDRTRRELELALQEEFPEKVIRRADRLGVLPELHPGFRGDGWLSRKFRKACKTSAPDKPAPELYLTLLAYRLTDDENRRLISGLRLPKSQARALEDCHRLKNNLELLAEPGLAPSAIYRFLEGISPTAITANYLATDSIVARRHIRLFLNKLRYIKTSLTGKDLQKMGIPPGPGMKEILGRLHQARLDGKVKTRRGEVEMVGEN